MKKIIFVIASFSLVTLFSACTPKTETSSNIRQVTSADTEVIASNEASSEPKAEPSSDNNQKDTVTVKDNLNEPKVLIAYFSASGVTRGVAHTMSESMNATLYEIVPETKYSDDDLNWRNDKSRSSVEMKDPASRPVMVGNVENISDYQVVFIGYPIWWNVAPHIINTFIEANDLGGKTIVPFCTAGSSSIDNSVVELRKVLPNSKVLDGKKLYSGVSRDEIVSWVNSLDLQIGIK